MDVKIYKTSDLQKRFNLPLSITQKDIKCPKIPVDITKIIEMTKAMWDEKDVYSKTYYKPLEKDKHHEFTLKLLNHYKPTPTPKITFTVQRKQTEASRMKTRQKHERFNKTGSSLKKIQKAFGSFEDFASSDASSTAITKKLSGEENDPRLESLLSLVSVSILKRTSVEHQRIFRLLHGKINVPDPVLHQICIVAGIAKFERGDTIAEPNTLQSMFYFVLHGSVEVKALDSQKLHSTKSLISAKALPALPSTTIAIVETNGQLGSLNTSRYTKNDFAIAKKPSILLRLDIHEYDRIIRLYAQDMKQKKIMIWLNGFSLIEGITMEKKLSIANVSSADL